MIFTATTTAQFEIDCLNDSYGNCEFRGIHYLQLDIYNTQEKDIRKILNKIENLGESDTRSEARLILKEIKEMIGEYGGLDDRTEDGTTEENLDGLLDCGLEKTLYDAGLDDEDIKLDFDEGKEINKNNFN